MGTRKLGPPPAHKDYAKNPSKRSLGLFLDKSGGIWATQTGTARLTGMNITTMHARFKKAGMPHSTGVALPHDRSAARYHYIGPKQAEQIKVDWQIFLDWKESQQ